MFSGVFFYTISTLIWALGRGMLVCVHVSGWSCCLLQHESRSMSHELPVPGLWRDWRLGQVSQCGRGGRWYVDTCPAGNTVLSHRHERKHGDAGDHHTTEWHRPWFHTVCQGILVTLVALNFWLLSSCNQVCMFVTFEWQLDCWWSYAPFNFQIPCIHCVAALFSAEILGLWLIIVVFVFGTTSFTC